MSLLIRTLALMIAATTLVVSPGFAQNQCSGRWRVSIDTSTGTCQANEHSRAIFVKDDGNIQLVNPSDQFDLSGSVSACSAVSFVITRGAEIAEGKGAITGDVAQGTWVVKKPASKKCTGTWFARKHADGL